MRNIFEIVDEFKISIVIFFFIFADNLEAGTISGADLTYKQTGAFQYEFTLKYYLNCSSPDFPPTNAPISVTSESCSINEPPQFLPIIFSESGSEVSKICTTLAGTGVSTTCMGGTMQGIRLYTYRAIISLPAQCSDWKVGFKHDFRYENTTNLTNPGTQSLYIETQINNLLVSDNNSPQFSALPTPFYCNDITTYDHGYYEENGDSLSFEIINPLADNNLVIPYAVGFSNSLPLAASFFSIDAQTGSLTFNPLAEQIAVICILVKEYRAGLLIGSTMRSLQFTVSNCDTPNLTIALNSTTPFEICANNNLQIDFQLTNLDQVSVVGNFESLQNVVFSSNINVDGNGTAYFNWTPTDSDTGVKYLVLKAINQTCPYISEQFLSIPITVHQNPIVFLENEMYICPNETKLINLESSSNLIDFVWFPNVGLSCNDCPNPFLNLANSSTYFVTITDTYSCTASSSLQVNVLQGPNIDAGQDIVIFEGETANLNVTGIYDSIEWYPKTDLSNPYIPNPIVNATSTNDFIVKATNTNGCTATDTVKLIVKSCDEILVPNAFSPNGDGLNELFKVLTPIPSIDFKLIIFDRWGKQLFITNNPELGWDGTYNGNQLPLGSYAFYCEFMCGSVLQSKKGFLVLLY